MVSIGGKKARGFERVLAVSYCKRGKWFGILKLKGSGYG